MNQKAVAHMNLVNNLFCDLHVRLANCETKGQRLSAIALKNAGRIKPIERWYLNALEAAIS